MCVATLDVLACCKQCCRMESVLSEGNYSMSELYLQVALPGFIEQVIQTYVIRGNSQHALCIGRESHCEMAAISYSRAI